MFKLNQSKILLALPVMLLCTGTLQAVTTPLTATASSVALSYQKPSTAGAATTIKITAAASTFFTIDPATVPSWLSLSALNGTAVPAPNGASIVFTPSAIGATLAPGNYTGSVHFVVTTGATDLVVPVTLTVKNPLAALSIKETTPGTLNWAKGAALPTVTITPVSSSEPISYTVTTTLTAPTSPTGWIKTDRTSGLAYSTGSAPITVTFIPQTFLVADVASHLTGTVVLTPSSGSAVTIAIDITVGPPTAAISSIYPAQTPVATSGTVQVVLTGTGFVNTTGQETVVKLTGTGVGDTATTLTTEVTIVNSSTIILAIPGATYLATAGDAVISVQNGAATPSTKNLKVTANPIINSVTNSASFVQTSGAPVVAPYEIISIFGDNFGADPTTPLLGTVDTFYRYPSKLTPVPSQDLVVKFYQSDGTTLIGAASILFATQYQINAIVPSGVVGNSTVKMTVTYNSNASDPITLNVVTADPGIYTTAASGQGQAAILHSDYSVNSSTNKATKGTTTVLIYLTGLGAPTNVAATTTTSTYPTSCILPSAYVTAVNALGTPPSPAWTTIDGAVLLSSNLGTGHLPPCFPATSNVTVSIGGVNATVLYAGFVADSAAGLYQINATVPATSAVGTVPVVVNVGTGVNQVKSQTNVTMVVQ
jgi:uncharacterized protein (TIGR03437 family)